MIDREFWNSGAAVVRAVQGRPPATVAVGRLYEMVEFFLAQPSNGNRDLALVVDPAERPLPLEAVTALRRREDFPLVC